MIAKILDAARGNDASRSVSRILSPPAVGDGHPSWMPVARHLVRSDPGPGTSSPWTPRRPPLFDLAPDGVYLAGRSPGRRWALTPPFHRCPGQVRGCVISVALSFGSPRLGVTQRPALRSPDFPRAACARDRLAGLPGEFYRRAATRAGASGAANGTSVRIDALS